MNGVLTGSKKVRDRVLWGQKRSNVLTNAVQLCFVLEVFSIEVVEHVELFEMTELGLCFTIGQLLRPKRSLLPSIGDVIDDAFIEEMPLLPLVPLKSETLRGID